MSKEELPDSSTKNQPVRATRFSGRLEGDPAIRALLREARAFEPNPGVAGKAGDFRIVTGSDVRLRVAPGMKSEVLLHLPKESIVVVLGKEDRTWLFVSYEHQGYMIEGYVSTTYLKKAN